MSLYNGSQKTSSVLCVVSLVILCTLILTACGSGGPSKQDIEDALDRPIQQANTAGANISLIIVSSSSCIMRDNSIYRCTVTASQDQVTSTHVIDVKLINSQWTNIGVVK